MASSDSATYRTDLVSRAGEEYKAWNVYQFNEPKDKYDNYKVRQFSERYGFLHKELVKYQIKELASPKKLNNIIEQVRDGARPLITVPDKDGKDMKLLIEALPKYNNLNFLSQTVNLLNERLY